MQGERWSREEIIIAFNLYCKTPFSSIDTRNPQIQELSKLLERTPSSVSMKLHNLASFDPQLQARGIKGLSNTSHLDRQVWEEFNSHWESLAFESEKLLAALRGRSVDDSVVIDLENLPLGAERETIVMARVNQRFFRDTILSSYNSTCCITGLNIDRLLVASHIKPWKDDVENRLNPRNGLCLNSLHDSAFDRGLIGIGPDGSVKLSKAVHDLVGNEAVRKFFLDFQNKAVTLPERFTPDPLLLQYHFEKVFLG